MYVIEVIPLKKTVGVGSLSYYSTATYPPGTVLSIPVRSTTIPGMVTKCDPVSSAKTALRTATFSLRKLPVQTETRRLPNSLIQTAEAIAKQTPAHLGSILFSLLPPDVRVGLHAYPELPDHLPGDSITPTILTATTPDRYIAYRSKIREAFAHRGSVVFVVPTSAAVEFAQAELSSGIEKRVITFSSSLTKKQLAQSYAAFEDLSHSKLIITTPNYAFLCRHDITAIIIEQSASQHYVSRSRPYLDARTNLKIFAHTIGAELIIGDILPNTEDEVARREERCTTYEEHSQRLHFASSLVVAEHPKDALAFSLLTDELSDRIRLSLAHRGRVLLYASRRGLAPVVLCKDCGYIFRCPDSGAPYSLLRTGLGESEKRWFYSSTSGIREPAADVCPDCGSWRLMERGIGIQHVYDHIKATHPKVKVVLVDHTTASTHAKAKKLVAEFYTERTAILIASNLVLPYLTKPIDYTGVISYEAMRAVPTWRADETVFHTLLSLRELTLKDLVVQTRSGVDELLSLATKGHIDQFYDGEIAIRRSLSYPPFAMFVLLTFVGTKEQVLETEQEITRILKGHNISFYNGPLSDTRKTIRYGLIRIPREKFPEESTITALAHLPPHIKVELNPAKIV